MLVDGLSADNNSAERSIRSVVVVARLVAVAIVRQEAQC